MSTDKQPPLIQGGQGRPDRAPEEVQGTPLGVIAVFVFGVVLLLALVAQCYQDASLNP